MVPIFNNGIWKLEALSDSDFANDKDTSYSFYGYIIYFCGVPVVWKSKSMKHVVLSTAEAEMWQFQKWSRRSRFCTECYVAWRLRYHCLSRFKWTMLVQYGWQIIVVCQRGQSMLIEGTFCERYDQGSSD